MGKRTKRMKTLWVEPDTWKALIVLKTKKEFKTINFLLKDMLNHYNGDK